MKTIKDDMLTNEDRLFIPESNGTHWLPNGTNGFLNISEGYKKAAIYIYNEIKKDEWINKPFIACAMVFCFRQFLEVRLKELIYFGKKELAKEPNFKKVHNLETLFEDYVSEVLPLLDRNYDSELINIVRNIMRDFDSKDPHSMSFRYPVDKNLQATLTIPNFDIDNFKKVMDKLSIFLDEQLKLIKLLKIYNEELEEEYKSYFAEYL